MKKLWIIVFLLIPCLCFGERSVTLPFEEKFHSGDTWTSDLLWLQGIGVTGVHLSSGCWSGGCAKFTPPTEPTGTSGGHSAFGAVSFSAQQRVNVRFLMKLGSTWAGTAESGGEGLGDKLVILPNAASGEHPILGLLANTSPQYFAPCTGENILYRCETRDYWPNGNETFYFGTGSLGAGDYATKWVCIEFEYNRTAGTIKTYITTLDSVFNETVINQKTGVTEDAPVSAEIGSYYNQHHSNADENTYMLLDEIKVSTTYIGPPAGFLGSTTTTNSGISMFGGISIR